LPVLAWRGAATLGGEALGAASSSVARVGNERALEAMDEWLPCPEASVATRGFPGYVSGHSTFSRPAGGARKLLRVRVSLAL
jgi:hypothetical protein